MPPAARVTDMHACPMITVLVPHVGGPIAMGFPTVLIGMMPAARMGDPATCVGPPDAIAMGSMTVLIGNQPAARILDPSVHGGVIVMGFPTVIIGDAGGGGGGAGGMSFAVSTNPDGSIQFGNHIRIEGDPTFRAQILGNLMRIANTPSSDPLRAPAGLTTLTNINNGRHDVTIHPWNATHTGNETTFNGANAGNPAVGSNSDIYVNPNHEPPTAANPAVNRPADVATQHELTHADHASQGTMNSFPPAVNPNNPDGEEEATINHDNAYRNDRGVPQRADHTVL